MRSKIIYSTNYEQSKNTLFFQNIFKTVNLFSFLEISKRKMKESDVLFLVQSICEFLNVNSDLGFCIESSMHCVKKEFQGALKNVILRLNQGEVFSKALEANNIFPDYAIKIVRAGEKNKNFKETFEMLRDFMQWNIEQKKKIKMAIAYPAFTFFVFVGIIFMFSNYIVPSIFGLLSSLNNNTASNYNAFLAFMFVLKSLVLSVLAFIMFVGVLYFYNIDMLERVVLKTPVFGDFMKYKAVYVTSYYLENSMKNGVSIVESFDIAIDSSSGMIKKTLIRIKEDVIKGVNINDSIKRFEFIPETVSQIIKTGENSGNLANAIGLVKQMFYSKYQVLMDKLINTLPMIMIVATALMMIGFVLLVFMPLYSFGL